MSHYITTKNATTDITLDKLHLSQMTRTKINQLIEEFTYQDALAKHGIPVDNKVLLYGKTGCGKTATAHALARRLGKKIISLNLSNVVSSKLGETARNISEVFRSAANGNTILFFDEFDFIGKTRDYDHKDAGEMKRLVNALLQQIDQMEPSTLLICATNHIEVIDSALLRRFQLKLQFDFPSTEQLDHYYDDLLSGFPKDFSTFERAYDLSYAEAKDYVLQEVKGNIIKREKQKKQLLFSYGTLQLDKVQLETYGRTLNGKEDALTGYRLEQLQIKDQMVLEKSNQRFHPIAIKSDSNEESILGKIFELTTEELLETDQYEVNDYKRVLETFASGNQAWVYIKK